MSKKTVIVTGASTGIGKAISQHFVDRGWNVVMNSKTKENLDNAYKELGSPANVKLVVGDVSKKSVGEEMVATALKYFGAVDVLINNAGQFSPKGFLDVDEDDLNKYFDVNLKGTFFTTQAAIKEMLNAGGGSVLNIGTVLVNHAIGGFPATAPVVSKGAIHALTVQLAAEFGKQNIRVNTIAPGIIRSPLQGKIGVDDSDSLAALHLLNRIGEPEDIAEVIYAVVNSNFISGEIINVDGGHVAGHHLS
ncbi:SDR family NAD(P)-dependent oxidoreductase [Flavihumibacter sp. ZG627]|uniref:SDR family NAD(P)-dependent oxidoreductase n=1 Tax=Flavihumibacter sp. ZG627 TaxID=1463156 RepID=UPI00057D4825|nr:SDR family oxidoreductase [Flavihumibacter sp. ZG627]KIC89084.1 glucose dehydrogenase [Flavihumibacter sp. ZG627]